MKCEIKSSTMTQFLYILSYISLFVFGAQIYYSHKVDVLVYSNKTTLLLLIYVLYWKFWKKHVSKCNILLLIKEYIKQHRCFSTLLFISFIIRIPSLFTFQRWDGSIYYACLKQGCDEFVFSIESFLKYFSQPHPAFGYYSWLGIGYYLSDGNSYGVMFSQILLSLITIYCFYGIITRIYLFKNKSLYIWATALFSVFPLFFGIETIVNPDYGVGCFFVIFVYACLNEWKIIELFIAFLLIFSKEQGALYYAACIGTLFAAKEIVYIKKHKSFGVKLFQQFGIRCIPGVISLSYYLMRGKTMLSFLDGMQGTVTNDAAKTQTLHAIGFNWDYIIEKLRQLFILNFSWLFTFFLILGIILFVINIVKKRFPSKIKNPIFFIVILVNFFVYILFNFFVVTYANPRYLTLSPFFLCILATCVIDNIGGKKLFQDIIMIILITINLIACFISIDPLSYIVFDSFKISEQYSMFQPYYKNKNMLPGDIYCDNTMYNRQYQYLTGLENIALRSIHYDGTIPIMQIDMSKGQREREGTDFVYLSLNGIPGVTQVFWDTQKERLAETGDVYIPTCYYYQEDLSVLSQSLPSTAYLFLLPRQNPDILDSVKKEYRTTLLNEVKYMGYSMKIYYLEKR